MRIFVVDHNCIFQYGHNAKSVFLYTEYFNSLGFKAIPLIPKNYAGSTVSAQRVLNYPYSHNIEPENPTFIQHRSINRFTNKLANVFGFDAKLALLRRNWRQVIDSYNIGRNDLIFFPSTDFFGAVSLIQCLSQASITHTAPRIHLRFIGVMENEGFKRPYPRLDLLRLIKSNVDYLDISVSAETPAYAAYLQMLLRKNVIYFPYPLFESKLSTITKTFFVSSPGSGRSDKGFFETLAIAKAVYSKPNSKDIRIIIQDMRKSDRRYNNQYSERLRSFPNIQLEPEYLSDEKIDQIMRASSAYLLPYCSDIYRLRGSAIFQEAISYGKPVIASDGTGFADLVSRYNVGYLADAHEDFAALIVRIYSEIKNGEEIKINRSLYRDDLEHATLSAMGKSK